MSIVEYILTILININNINNDINKVGIIRNSRREPFYFILCKFNERQEMERKGKMNNSSSDE